MILRELREIDQATDDILVYGHDGANNQKIKTDTIGRIDIISDNLDVALSTLKTVLDDIDANTDTLEAKTQSIRDQLDVVLSSRASEVTAQALLDALGQQSGTDILTVLQNLSLDINTSGLATEDTLSQIQVLLTTIETDLQTIIARLDVNLSTRASEVTLGSVLSELQSIDAKDFATESTLVEVRDTIGQESDSTVLSRLLDIFNTLVSSFVNGLAKIKIWDGTNVTDVIDDGTNKRLAVDSKTDKSQIFEEGGQERTVVIDDTNRELLNEILKQMKIMNLHLSIISDEQIDKEEIL